MKKRAMIFGDHDERTLQQYYATLKSSDLAAIMADGHLGYGVPIGCVMANKNKIAPKCVGFDEYCGNDAVKLDIKADKLTDEVKNKIVAEIRRCIGFGLPRRGIRRNQLMNEIPLEERYDFLDGAVSEKYFSKWEMQYQDWEKNQFARIENMNIYDRHFKDQLRSKAMLQIGTVGGGNHYVDIFADENDDVWVGTHFGSRGLGHTIATSFFKQLGYKDDMMSPVEYIERGNMLFNPYVETLEVAGEYARMGREMVCDAVRIIISKCAKLHVKVIERVHNHHNAMWREQINGEMYFVTRKGATPVKPGQSCFVGASMIENSYILEGTDKCTYENCLSSTIHGAGRVMSRREAKGKIKWKTGEVIEPGKIDRDYMMDEIEKSGVKVLGGDLDEFRDVYRRLPEVVTMQNDTVRIKHELRPLVVAMAGFDGLDDEYKD